MQIWGSSRSLPGKTAGIARHAEDEGWSGLTFTDSQNLSGDPYVAMAVAAGVTTSLRLATGVTNPWTRHPAVTASAILCVDVESGGRAELGIGRGDSALAYLGLAPASLPRMRRYLRALRAYLRGDAIPLPEVMDSGAQPIDARLPLGEAPADSRIEWLRQHHRDRRPVPVFVTSSGPKVIAMAAVLADRVTLAVGADPGRVRWAVGIAREACPQVRIAAFVNVLVDDDQDRALALASGSIASFARFSAMHGAVGGPADSAARAVLEGVPRAYEITRHFETAAQSDVITAQFASRYAILGPGSYCQERLQELAELGIDRFHVVGAARDVSRADAVASRRRFVDEVLADLSPA
jgi:5,10-methylenetetrahydromethanopterin reductase